MNLYWLRAFSSSYGKFVTASEQPEQCTFEEPVAEGYSQTGHSIQMSVPPTRHF
jgi:hypothetical protein